MNLKVIMLSERYHTEERAFHYSNYIKFQKIQIKQRADQLLPEGKKGEQGKIKGQDFKRDQGKFVG